LSDLKELKHIWHNKSAYQAKEFIRVNDIKKFIQSYFKPIKKLDEGTLLLLKQSDILCKIAMDIVYSLDVVIV
jgi:hypothetical protein